MGAAAFEESEVESGYIDGAIRLIVELYVLSCLVGTVVFVFRTRVIHFSNHDVSIGRDVSWQTDSGVSLHLLMSETA